MSTLGTGSTILPFVFSWFPKSPSSHTATVSIAIPLEDRNIPQVHPNASTLGTVGTLLPFVFSKIS